jgi:caffeoyl-CoA O-methyltransferase
MLSFVSKELEEYVVRHTSALSDVHDRIWKETHENTRFPQMLVGPLEGAFLRFLVRMTGAKRVLEIGMFTGYSALAMAEALPADGQLITCDINPDTTEMARRYFSASPHGRKIEVKLGPAIETLKSLSGPFDICFIDADKEGYAAYYDACMELVRKNGLIVLDNVLQSGRVLDTKDSRGREMDLLNERITKDARVENVLLPIRDGIMLVCKL